MKRRLHRPGTALLLCALVLNAAAQDDGGRAAREREALRRTQSALKQSQEQQAALAREKSELSAQASKLGDTARQAQSQLAGARSEAARLRTELVRVTSELDTLRVQAEADKKGAQLRADESAQRLAEAMRVAAERTHTVGSMTALLERVTQSLAKAEKANREMQAFGLELIDRLRGRSSGVALGAVDPVLGLKQVRLENEAEAMRDRLDALKLPPQGQ